MSIVVVHLYPRELGINGDVGNVMALRKRAEWRGMPLTVHDHEIGAELPETVHLFHIGSGPASGLEAVRADLTRIAPTLRDHASRGTPVLAIAGGWQLLGREIVDIDGTVTPGAGVFPTRATLTTERRVGEVVATSQHGELAGFENHGAVTELLEHATPFAEITHREGAAPGPDGVQYFNSIGTNLHGPLLPMNPAVADALLRTAAGAADVRFGPGTDDRLRLADDRAARSREAVRRRLGA